jgi:hypothetical protein
MVGLFFHHPTMNGSRHICLIFGLLAFSSHSNEWEQAIILLFLAIWG